MRKNKLIELLQAIKGNPEVKVYNGYVGDFMNLHKPKVSKIHRMSNKKRLHFVNLENVSRGISETTTLTKEDDWELVKESFDDESKPIILLEPKERGVTSYGGDSGSDLKY
jgi:hypothetical protein